jgi:hypothetical protein
MVQGVPGREGVDVFARPYDWPSERANGGQCMDCGFLARRNINPTHPSVEEVSVEQRKRGDLFRLRTGAPSMPWCFVRPSSEVDLQREVETVAAGERERAREAGTPDFAQVSLPESDAIVVLAKDRKCPEWYWYTPPLSPAEHRVERTMLRLKEMERKQAETSLKVAEALQDIAQQTLDIHRESQAAVGKTDRFTTRWTRIAVGFSVASIVIVAVSYFLPHLGADIAAHILGASPVPLP